MTAYYNENDPKAAAWLRELIAAGLIAPGEVDDRSIEDVEPRDLAGFAQCHFFAGIGGWSYALRLAGWPDSRPVWTGSCPCQPFSAAGKGTGADDNRHLWPDFRWLIDQCRPSTVFGEQVASPLGRQWLAGVQADLEAMGYRSAAADLCAAGVGAPHIRQRLFWVADTANCDGRGRERRAQAGAGEESLGGRGFAGSGSDGGLGDAELKGLEGHARHEPDRHQPGRKQAQADRPVASPGGHSWDGIYIPCADGKARRIEPGLEPLVDGFSDCMADVLSCHFATWLEIVEHAQKTQTDPDQVLRMVREAVRQETSGEEQPTGVRRQFHAPALLLDLLFGAETTRDRIAVDSRSKKESIEIVDRAMRSLRRDSGTVRASHRRQSEKQRPEEFAAPVHELSLILARHVEAYGAAVQKAHAATCRVTLLRGYGNAIVPAVAQVFIKAYDDVRQDEA